MAIPWSGLRQKVKEMTPASLLFPSHHGTQCRPVHVSYCASPIATPEQLESTQHKEYRPTTRRTCSHNVARLPTVVS